MERQTPVCSRNNSPAAKTGYYPTPRASASQEESSNSQRKHSLQLVIEEELTDKCLESGSQLSIRLFSHAQVPQPSSPSVTVKDQTWTTLEASLFSTLYGTYPGEMWDQKGTARQSPVYFLKQDCTRHSAERIHGPISSVTATRPQTFSVFYLPFCLRFFLSPWLLPTFRTLSTVLGRSK